jgi:hypothetical protein
MLQRRCELNKENLRYQRIKKLFPNANEENILNYLQYSGDGSDNLTDEELDEDLEDFCSK